MRKSAIFDRVVGKIGQMHEALAEADVFSACHAACEGAVGPLSLSGYVVAQGGQSVRHVAEIGPEAQAWDTDWLIGGTAFPEHRARDGSPLLAVPLVDQGRTVGGVILAGPNLRSDKARRRCRQLIAPCALALRAFHQRRLSQMLIEVLKESEEGISFYDAQDGILFTNAAYHRIFPHYPEPSQLIGRSHLDLYRMDLDAGIIDDPVALADPDAYLADRRRKADALVGRQREIQSIAGRTYIYTRTRSQTGTSLSRRIDITEQAAAEAQLRERKQELHRLAFRDPLTGLFNRAHLMRLIERLRGLLRDEALDAVAVFLIDLDRFKAVNDTYGHECGDAVLRSVARSISDTVAADDTVFRLGGDEFVVVFERRLTPPDLSAIADAILAALAEPIRHGDAVLKIGASIGMACSSGTAASLDTIIADADLAMYEAKKRKGSTAVPFEPGMRADMLDRMRLLDDAREALRQGAFELQYQPQFDARTLRLVGFEALARWHHPDRGLVPPAIFIPLLEEHGLIDHLGEWVLRTACAEAADWPGDLHVAVNVSLLQVRSGLFQSTLADCLLRSGLAPHRLELEITESVFIADAADTLSQLGRWKALGLRIALDDFGKGYSSLSYLSQLPIDKIKIDQGFVARLDPRHSDKAAEIILRSIVSLGLALGKTVTAEGVEHAGQLAFLRDLGCSEVQGFLLGKPMTPIEARRLSALPEVPRRFPLAS